MKKHFLLLSALIGLSLCTNAQSLDFDGNDDYVDVSANTSIPSGNTFYTIEAWINANTMGAKGIAGWGNYGSTNQVNAFRLTNNGLVNYWWGNDLSVVTGDLTGAWHHVAATYDGITRTIYLDGNAVASDSPLGHGVPFTNNLSIGLTAPVFNEYFDGSLDEVRIWNIARTQTEIQNNLYCSLSGAQPGLVLNYNFNQGVPNANNSGVTIANDISGNSNSGTLTNFNLSGTTSNWTGDMSSSFSPVVSIVSSTASVPVTGNVNVTFTATVTNGGASPSYQWIKNGANIFGATASVYNDNTLTPNDTISCIVTSSLPCLTFLQGISNKITIVYYTNAALDFDGNDDYVNTTVNCDNTLMPDVTWEAWVMPTNPGNSNWQMVMDVEDGNWDRFVAIQNGFFSMGMGNGAFQPVAADFNQWQHIAVVYTGTELKFYKNGVQYIFGGTVDTLAQNSLATPFRLGNASYGLPFTGVIDEVRVWNVERTQAEIQNNMNCSIALPQAGLVANYNFNEGIPNANNAGVATLTDVSGNANNGTLYNFALNGTTSNWVNNVTTFIADPTVTISANPAIVPAGNNNVTFTAAAPNAGPFASYQWMKNNTMVGANGTTYTDNSLTLLDSVWCVVNPNSACAAMPMASSNTVHISYTGGPMKLGAAINAGACGEIDYKLTGGITGVRVVRIVQNNPTLPLNIAELQVFELFTGNNVALASNGSTSDNSSYYNIVSFPPINLIDGDTGQTSGNFTHTQNGAGEWVEVILPRKTNIDLVRIFNRQDCCQDREQDVTLQYFGDSAATQLLYEASIDAYQNQNYNFGSSWNALDAVTNLPAITRVNDSIYKAAPLFSGSYSLQIKDVVNDSVKKVKVISVSVPPAPTVMSPENFCLNATPVVLNATGTNLLWYTGPTGGAGSNTAPTANTTSAGTTDYYVSQTTGVCEGNRSQIKVTVHALPIVNATANNYTVCVGTTVTLTASGAANFSWSSGGTAITENETPANTTTYFVVGTDANGCSDSAFVTINTNTLPNVAASAASNTICFGSSTVLTATGATTYNWTCGSVTDTAHINPTGNATYTVTGTDAAGCQNTATVSVNVNSAIDVSTSLNLNIITANQNAATYQWVDCNNANTAIAGETNQSFTAQNPGDYAVVVTQGACSDTSACAHIVTTSIAANKTETKLTLYPNPNNGTFTISAAREGVYNLINELGQVVQSIKLNASNNYNFTITGISNGIYFVVGFSGSQVLRQKVVITN